MRRRISDGVAGRSARALPFAGASRQPIMIAKRFRIRSVKGVNIRRGDIYYADLSPVVGSEQGGVRPVLIVQNDIETASVDSDRNGDLKPARESEFADAYFLKHRTPGLSRDSIVLLEQVRTIDKHRLKGGWGGLTGIPCRWSTRPCPSALGWTAPAASGRLHRNGPPEAVDEARLKAARINPGGNGKDKSKKECYKMALTSKG